MGAGRDTDKGAPPSETPLQPPPVYMEKEPLPSSDPVVVPIGRSEPPVLSQRDRCREQCRRRRGRCCCYCCTILVVLILCCTILPIAIVAITKDLWMEPYVDMSFARSRGMSRSFSQGEDVIISCKVEFNTKTIPLVQWFHNADQRTNSYGYRLFAVHNKVTNPEYKERFHFRSTSSGDNDIAYQMVIQNVGPQDAGSYACQVPKPRGPLDTWQISDSDSSSSSSEDHDDDDDDDDHDDDDHDGDRDKKHKKGCWSRGRRSDHIYVGVRRK